MLLAIDIGNTNTHFGVWAGERWKDLWLSPTGVAMDSAVLRARVLGVEGSQQAVRTILSSVVREATASVSETIQEAFGSPAIHFTSESGVGINVHYEPRESLGADRLANALGLLSRFKAPALAIDIGTATTFDAVDRLGGFAGGAIIPGPKLSFKSLHRGSSALPDLELGSIPSSAIGQTTEAAIRAGVLLGQAAAIESIGRTIVRELGEDTLVVATGGDAGIFRDLCPIISELIPTLTLDGLIEADRRLGA